MLAKKLMMATAAKPQLYVDDVFSTYLYTGNGSTQTITNGIDLAGEGGLVWIKKRDTAVSNSLTDTGRGTSRLLRTNLTMGEVFSAGQFLNAFNTNGFTLFANSDVNGNAGQYVSWSFRRAPKFFDVVTYTGNGASNRQIAHDLGAEPGFITTKSTSTTGDWNTYHRSATGDLVLNSTAAQTGSRAIINAADSSTFTVSGVANTNGIQYVAYLWAHDPAEDGIVQCGSFTTDGSGGATVDLGWEPQYLMMKRFDGSTEWEVLDIMRGWCVGSTDARIYASSSSAESLFERGYPTAAGFRISLGASGLDYIYLAIRRPNKPPESGTEVYNAVLQNPQSSGTIRNIGFASDLIIARPLSASPFYISDRLRGFPSAGNSLNTITLESASTKAEYSQYPYLYNVWNDTARDGDLSFSTNGVGYNFRRAQGFHDQICYTGTGANKTEAHILGKQPELWLAKQRNAAGSWVWGSTLLNANEKIVMPSPNGRVTDATAWNSTYPTATNISLGTLADVNASGGTYTLYMWATLAGISKVGTYTGNGSSQTIDCGFTTGARFVMIIRMTASTAQDIYLWDSGRGIVAGNDPRLSLNTTAAEVTGLDTIDPTNVGFVVNTDASNVNVSGAEYLYLAIA